MKDIVIAGYARSPFHFANKGGLTKVRPDDPKVAALLCNLSSPKLLMITQILRCIPHVLTH